MSDYLLSASSSCSYAVLATIADEVEEQPMTGEERRAQRKAVSLSLRFDLHFIDFPIYLLTPTHYCCCCLAPGASVVGAAHACELRCDSDRLPHPPPSAARTTTRAYSGHRIISNCFALLCFVFVKLVQLNWLENLSGMLALQIVA